MGPAADESEGMIETRYTYDKTGRLIMTITDGQAPVTTGYDKAGNPVRQSIHLPDGDRMSKTETRYTTLSSETPGYPSDLSEEAVFRLTVNTLNAGELEESTTRNYTLVSEVKGTLESLSLNRDALGNWSWQRVDNRYANRVTTASVPGQERPVETITLDGQVVRTTDSAGITTHYTGQYTASGQTSTVIDGRGNTATVAYDKAGRAIRGIDAAGNTVTTRYDYATGQPSLITDQLGRETHYLYDKRGRRIAQYGSGAQPVKWGYDEDNRMVSLTTWREPSTRYDTLPSTPGDTTTWEYHPRTGRLKAKHFTDGTATTYRYDAYGKPIVETNGNGESIYYTYRELSGELASKQIGGGDDDVQYFGYDAAGRLAQVKDKAGKTTFQYDGHGRKIREQVVSKVATSELAFRYDSFGRNEGYTLAINGREVQKVAHAYDTAGRLAVATLDHNEHFIYGYDAGLGHNNIITYPNGIEKTCRLDPSRDIVNHISYRNTDTSQNIYDEQMTVDAAGFMTERMDSIGQHITSQNFEYNARGELVIASHGLNKQFEWQYDNIGNRSMQQDWERKHYQTNNLNQYVSLSDQSNRKSLVLDSDRIIRYMNIPNQRQAEGQYDRAGNATTYKLRDSLEWTVSYNAENRPLRFDSREHGVHSQIDMAYDHMGRRVDKKTLSDGELVEWRKFIYHGYTLIAELRAVDGDNPVFEVYNTFMWDPSQPVATRPLTWTNWNNGTWNPEPPKHEGEYHPFWYDSEEFWYETHAFYEEEIPVSGRYYYLHDHNKNVKVITDRSGKLQGAYDYTPFGAHSRVSLGLVKCNPLRFSSEYYDKELELVYYNFRHYNPQDGRWLSRDPIAEQGGWNLYGFAGNNPMNNWDILGLNKVKVYFPRPDVSKIQPEESPRENYSYTDNEGKYSFTCCCGGEEGNFQIFCTATYKPKIYISKGQADELNLTEDLLYGHEQRHVLSRIIRMIEILKPLTRQTIRAKTWMQCEMESKHYREKYYNLIDEDFKYSDHYGDPRATGYSPQNSVGYPPI